MQDGRIHSLHDSKSCDCEEVDKIVYKILWVASDDNMYEHFVGYQCFICNDAFAGPAAENVTIIFIPLVNHYHQAHHQVSKFLAFAYVPVEKAFFDELTAHIRPEIEAKIAELKKQGGETIH